MILVDPGDKWDLGTWLKSVSAVTLAVLGRELIKRWKRTSREKIDAEEMLIKELMVRNAELSARVDVAQAEYSRAMLALQDAYEERVKAHRERAHELSQKLMVAYFELAQRGWQDKAEGLDPNRNRRKGDNA